MPDSYQIRLGKYIIVKARQEAGGRRQEDYNPILKPDLVSPHPRLC